MLAANTLWLGFEVKGGKNLPDKNSSGTSLSAKAEFIADKLD